MLRLMSMLRSALLGFVPAMVTCSPAPPSSSPAPQPAASVAPTVSTDAAVAAATASSAVGEQLPAEAAWGKAVRVSMAGDELLGCRTLKLPGWARVVCDSPKNIFTEAPAKAAVDAGDAKVSIATTDGGTAVTFAWRPGTTVAISLFYMIDVIVLRAIWAEGAAEPAQIAVARGVPAASAEEVAKFLCECGRERMALLPEQACGLGDVMTRLECLRTHLAPGNCGPWLECETLEPSGSADCLPDEAHDGMCAVCSCAMVCDDGKHSCPPGMQCVAGSRVPKICVQAD